jgi:hypothetical protein
MDLAVVSAAYIFDNLSHSRGWSLDVLTCACISLLAGAMLGSIFMRLSQACRNIGTAMFGQDAFTLAELPRQHSGEEYMRSNSRL